VPYPKSVFFIIGNEFCERFSYYGMKAILSLYLQRKLHFDEDKATVGPQSRRISVILENPAASTSMLSDLGRKGNMSPSYKERRRRIGSEESLTNGFKKDNNLWPSNKNTILLTFNEENILPFLLNDMYCIVCFCLL
jgi:hypothetical protein